MTQQIGELVRIATAEDPRGRVSFVESERDVPFAIRRVYFLHSVEAGTARGRHAHRTLRQLIIAAAGSFEVLLRDGRSSRRVVLDDPTVGLLVDAMIWRELSHFTPGACALVLASDHFDEADYIRDLDEFLRLAGNDS